MGDDIVAVATGAMSRGFSSLNVLNDVGAFLWEQLLAEGGADENSLVSAVIEYETDEKPRGPIPRNY